MTPDCLHASWFVIYIIICRLHVQEKKTLKLSNGLYLGGMSVFFPDITFVSDIFQVTFKNSFTFVFSCNNNCRVIKEKYNNHNVVLTLVVSERVPIYHAREHEGFNRYIRGTSDPEHL